MAITRVDGGLWIGMSPVWFNAGPSLTGSTGLTASAHKIALVCHAPLTGTLHSFEVLVGTVSNAPDNGLRFSFQNISSSFPDGTQDQYRTVTSGISSNTWLAPPGPITSDGTDIGSKRSVTAGDLLACVIEFESFVASDSIAFSLKNMQVVANMIGSISAYTANFTSSWSDTENTMCLVLKYDSDGYVNVQPDVLPITAINTRSTFASNSTPDERALRFQLPFAAELDGVQIRGDFNGTTDIVLYDSTSSVLATVSVPINAQHSGNGGAIIVPFPRTSLSASTTYRLAVKPTSTTNITIYDFDVSTNAHLGAVPGGIQMYNSTRTDAGSWSDTTTQRPFINLRLSGVDISAGGGGGGGSFTFIG